MSEMTHNEPCFHHPNGLLRASSRHAPTIVRAHADLCAALQHPAEETVAIRRAAVEMETWQQEHPELVRGT